MGKRGRARRRARADGGGGKGRTRSARSGGGRKSRRKRDGKRTRKATAAEWLKSVLLGVAVVVVMRLFVFQTFFIDSGSMQDTLLIGDFVYVNRLAMGSPVPFTGLRVPGYSEPRRGDILVFDPPHDDTLTVVKRLVGMPGDTLEMRERVLYLNGEPRDEPYVVHAGFPDGHSPEMLWQMEVLVGGPRDDYMPTRDTWGPLVIPEDRYFVMGDYRGDSLDSRYWGLLERSRFLGRASFIYFSYDRGSMRPFSWITEVRGSRIGDRVR